MGVGSAGDRYRYTGHLRDQETGNDYVGARFYSNARGRWLSVDPVRGNVGNPQRLNRYAYVLNDPVNYLDPNGAEPLRIRVHVWGELPWTWFEEAFTRSGPGGAGGSSGQGELGAFPARGVSRNEGLVSETRARSGRDTVEDDNLAVPHEGPSLSLRPARERAGHPGVRLKDFRREAGIVIAESGQPPHVAQTQLGHSSVKTTEKYYAHYSPEFAVGRAREALENRERNGRPDGRQISGGAPSGGRVETLKTPENPRLQPRGFSTD